MRASLGGVMRAVLSAFYSHPWAWNEIGFGGPAYPRGYARFGVGQRETGRPRRSSPSTRCGHANELGEQRRDVRAKGALRPPENDSAFLLDATVARSDRADGATTGRL